MKHLVVGFEGYAEGLVHGGLARGRNQDKNLDGNIRKDRSQDIKKKICHFKKGMDTLEIIAIN